MVNHRLNIDSFEPSLSWTMTPRLVVQGGVTIQILDGFQSNPYRSVLVGSQHRTPQEHLPQFRQRYAVFARAAYAFPEMRASTLGMLRLYDDSWAVRAVTADVTVNKYIGQSMLFSARGHYHLQGGASFYRDAQGYRFLGPAGQYWTGDRELSPMSNYLVGGKIAFLRRPAPGALVLVRRDGAGREVRDPLLPPRLPTPPTPTESSPTSSRARSRCGFNNLG